MNKSAYLDGYLTKMAGVGDIAAKGAEAGVDLLSALLPYALVVPPLLGAGAGLAHSKMTSPTVMDQESVQKALEAAELEEFAAELKRRQAQEEFEAAKRNEEKESPSARTLHI
jgi:hypothetical protein